MRKVDKVAKKIGGNLYIKTFEQLKYKLRYHCITQVDRIESTNPEQYWWDFEKESKKMAYPLVSVIVPNYNHASFLVERLESIYNQTYKNIEVILLDDCSTDNSREILSYYAKKYAHKTITLFNDVNSQRVFRQWNKGLNVAKGELIWIAESDDYCELDFLEKKDMRPVWNGFPNWFHQFFIDIHFNLCYAVIDIL